MAYNIGLNVVETDGTGVAALVGAATSVAGFNITTQRGIPNRPLHVTTFKEFTSYFGSMIAGSYGAYMVKGFFDNGGQNAYINRVVSSDSTTGALAANQKFSDGTNNTIEVDAGQLGTADPGAWGNNLYMQIDLDNGDPQRVQEIAPATITGTALTEPIDMSSPPTISINVDGESTPTSITFSAADFADAKNAKLAEIAAAISKRTTKLTASITSDKKLALVSTGQAAHLNKTFTSLNITAAVPTLGITAGTATGRAATFSGTGTTLMSIDDFQPNEAIQISDGTHAGIAKVLRTHPATSAIEWSPAVANPGTFDATKTTVTPLRFRITVAYGGNATSNVVETFDGLSMEPDAPNYAVSAVNDEINGSGYVILKDLHDGSGVGKNLPQEVGFTQLTNGRDGSPLVSDYVGDASSGTGFYAFDPAGIQLLTCERTDPAIVTSALGYCANRGECMYVGAVPLGFVQARQAIKYGQAFQGKKVYGALYGPWIKILDPASTAANPLKLVPPSGHVMGVFARVETTRGIWKAPAGDEAVVMGAVDIESQLSDADHTDLVKSGSINGIRAVPGAGIVVDASRTLSTDPRWLYVNVRLLFNYVKSTLRQGLRWVRQEPNRDTLWDAVKFGSVTPFLMGLWRQGAFGSGKANDVFTVICDATNNPPSQVDQGIFTLEVYFYPSKPAETIVIIVGQQASGATASEA